MNPTACITGASSGIGREFAHQLAQRKYDLEITGRNVEALDRVEMELNSHYDVQVNSTIADLSTEEGIDEFNTVIGKVSDLEFLVNSAGFGLVGSFTSLTKKQQLDMLTVHTRAPITFMYTAIPLMREHGQGNIVNVSSVAAFTRYPSSGLYAPTKAFIVKHCRGLQRFLKKDNIRVQALCPGYVRTSFHDRETFEKTNAYEKIPKFLWMKPDEVVSGSLANLSKAVYVPGWKYKIIRLLLSTGLIRR